MLESLEQTDIHRMTIETSEEQTPNFDIEQEITDKNWAELVKAVEECDGDMYCIKLAELKIISPERFSQLTVDEEKVRVSYRERKKNIEVFLPTDITGAFFTLENTVSHTSFGRKIEPEILSRLEKSARKSLDLCLANLNYNSALRIMASMKLLGLSYSPNTLKEADFDHLKFQIDSLRADLSSSDDDLHSLHVLTRRLIQLKVVFPDYKPAPFSAEEYDDIKQIINVHQISANIGNALSVAARMANVKLALADEIIMDDDGLHAVYKTTEKPLESGLTKLPVQRNF